MSRSDYSWCKGRFVVGGFLSSSTEGGHEWSCGNWFVMMRHGVVPIVACARCRGGGGIGGDGRF